MLLKNLIKKKIYSNNKNLKIKDLSTDSRKIKKGDLFFAIKGNKTNGILFIKEALKKGAAAIIVDKDTTFLNLVRGEREHDNYGITHTIKHVFVDFI